MSQVIGNGKKLIKSFSDLIIWQATRLTINIYKITDTFPKTERFGLTSQLQRAASSVGANIAEGFGRYYFKDKIRFFYQSRGSLCEVQNFLLICSELGYIPHQDVHTLLQSYNTLLAQINSFITSIEKSYDI